MEQEINAILEMNIPNFKKSELIQALLDKKNDVKMFKEGGDIKYVNPTDIITVGDKEYEVEIADTDEKRKDGLSRCTRLPKSEGMLFVFEQPTNAYFTMEETSIDLDIVFMDEQGTVLEIHSVKAHDPNHVTCNTPYQYVLEVNINSGIQKGDELNSDDLDLNEEEKETAKHSRMLVLDENGNVQMKLHGGERIVSMIKTRQLVKAAIKAYRSDEDSDYKKVGKLIFKELDAQDSRDPQYVEKNLRGGLTHLAAKSRKDFEDESEDVPNIMINPASVQGASFVFPEITKTQESKKPTSVWAEFDEMFKKQAELPQTPYNATTASGVLGINYLMTKHGLSKLAATAALKVFKAESGLIPGRRNQAELEDLGDQSAGIGIAQWSNSRRADYLRFMDSHGYTTPTLENELDFFIEEGKTRPVFWNAFTTAPDVNSAVDAMYYGYENGSRNAMATRDSIIARYTKAWLDRGYSKAFNIDDSLNTRYNAKI